MKSRVFGLVVAGILLGGLTGLAEEALFWCFENSGVEYFDGTTRPVSEVADGGVDAVRVKAFSGGTTAYLDLYAGDDGGFVKLGDALAMSDDWIVEPLYAGLGEYARSGVRFMIELGTYAGPGGWTALAYGSLAEYGALLADRHIQEMSPVAVPATAWNGGTFTIPEPSGALLLLCGLGVLGLRRGRAAGGRR